jgi:hypothetical protein
MVLLHEQETIWSQYSPVFQLSYFAIVDCGLPLTPEWGDLARTRRLKHYCKENENIQRDSRVSFWDQGIGGSNSLSPANIFKPSISHTDRQKHRDDSNFRLERVL